MNPKLKRITMNRYSKIMDKIIKKKLPVPESLILMLNEASKYEIIEKNAKTKTV
jgi:hypothetical protein